MRPFLRVEGDEGELAGQMSRPGAVEVDAHPQHMIVTVIMQFVDATHHLVPTPDPARQRDTSRDAGGEHQQDHQWADGRFPVGGWQQDRRMHHQHQIGQCQLAVRLEEPAVGNALAQRQHEQQRGGVECPFADAFGKAAQAVQVTVEGIR